MGFRFAADVKHHGVVLEFYRDCFIGIDPFFGIGHGDLSGLPGLASVIAVDRDNNAWAMGIAPIPCRKPYRHDETSSLKLNAVIGAGGQYFPVVVFFEALECRRDLDRRCPSQPVVHAALIKATFVLEAKKHMHSPIAVRDHDRVVVCHIVGVDVFEGRGEGILALWPVDICDALWGTPSPAFVRTATHEDADIVPITHSCGALPGLAPREDGSLSCDHDARNMVDIVRGIFAHGEKGLLIQEWLRCEQRRGLKQKYGKE
jgi:hypothetical protein